MSLSIRASALPLAFRCAQSLRPRPPVIDERNPAADVGTAAHDWCATCGWDLDRVPEIAARHGIEDLAELRMLCAKARAMADKLGIFEGQPERALAAPLGDLTVTGHVDWHEPGDVRAKAIDWKFGMKDRDHFQQVRAYACLTLLTDTHLYEVQAITAWVRDEEIESELFTRAEVARWDAEVQAVSKDETYRPGNHCQHCRRLHECEAGRRQLARDIQLFGASVRSIEELPPEEAIDLLERADVVAALAKRVREEFREHIIANGDLEAPDGRRLTISTQKNREIKVLEAWPVLEERFSPEELAESIKVSLSSLEEIVAAKAARGQGAARKRELSKSLEGAIEFKEIQKLVVRRK